MSRLFTLEEARTLLPALRPLLLAMQEQRRALRAAEAALSEINRAARSNGHNLEPKIGEAKQAVEAALQSLRASIVEITALGVEIKDLDQALVDFPCQRDGRIVNLCWHVGEADIGYWHEVDTGFSDRQPL